MNLQAESVTGPVEKSDILSFPDLGRISAVLEKLLDRLVNFHSVDAGFDFSKCESLSLFHSFPKFALCLACSSAHNCPRQIAPITGLGVAREDIEDDQRVRVERTESALMRITSLIAAGDDRVRRRATGA